MIPYGLILLISALKEFHFFVTVGPSAPFGPALNPPKIETVYFECSQIRSVRFNHTFLTYPAFYFLKGK